MFGAISGLWETMETLQKEHERLAKKQKVASEKVIASVDQLIAQAERCRMVFANLPTAMEGVEAAAGGGASVETPSSQEEEAEKRMMLLALQQTTTKTINAVASERKELNIIAARFGKAIDKEFSVDLERASQTKESPLNQTVLNQVIAEEFFCGGQFQLGEVFSTEAGVQVDPKLKTNLLELQEIRSSLERHELQPALEWAKTNREQLRRQGSTLEFQLHRLHFLELIKAGHQREALNYARSTFHQFSPAHLSDIQKLMGSLVYASKLGRAASSSPYDTMFTADTWREVSTAFYRDCCALLSLPEQSPLLACIDAGAIAAPRLAKVVQLMKAKVGVSELPNGNGATAKELPVQMEGAEFQYHNIFVCPVSREQSTPQNPPVMLPCGHVICWVSMEKLSKGSRFKCPYCPSEQFPSQTKILYF